MKKKNFWKQAQIEIAQDMIQKRFGGKTRNEKTAKEKSGK